MNKSEPVTASGELVSFIRDEPADEDFFQTHGRLARAIAAAVRSDHKLRVIGLIGRWGSGKSTVIRQLKKELCSPNPRDDTRFHIFSYDAWLHQSDPVRRSFLESLLDYLNSEQLTSGDTWNEKLLELTGQIEKTDVTQTPVLTNDAKWILGSLLPVPIAIGLLDLDTIKDAFGKTWSAAGVISFWLSIVILMIPLAVTYFRYSINREYKLALGEELPLLPILMNKSVEKTRSITQRSPDPTSIEFCRIFREIMTEATKAGDRFVFVIDNLDRVAEKEALQIWATVRAFFLETSENEVLATDRPLPLVILPVDTHALERIFALSEDKAEARELAQSFVNKTFDITFEVNEPVMSDWRAYLERQMKKVFGPSLAGTCIFWTRHFFENNLQKSKTKVTPRELNKLVNRIAALEIQWKNENIDFEVLSYFAVHSAEAASDILKFISDPQNDIENIVEDWKLQFAAVHYGVARDKAAQVLLEEPLRNAVTNLDRKAFEALVNVPGFGDTFERLTTSSSLNGADGQPSFELVTNASILLGTVQADGAYWRLQSWRNLIDRYFDSAEIGDASDELAARFSSLFDHLEDQDEKQAFLDGASAHVGTALSGPQTDTTLQQLREAAFCLLSFAERESLAAPTFDIDGEPSFLVSLLAALSDHENIWERLRTDLSVPSVVEAAATALRTPIEFIRVPPATMVLRDARAATLFESGDEPNFAPLVVAASEILRQQNVQGAVPSAVKTLGLLLKNNFSKPAVEALLDEGHFQNQLGAASTDMDFQCSLIAIFIWSGRNFSPPTTVRWEDLIRQPAFLPRLYERLREFVGLETMRPIWAAHRKAPSARVIIDALIEHVINTNDLGTIPLLEIVSDPDKYLYVVPYRLRSRFVWLLESYEKFWVRLEEAPLNDGLAEAAALMARKGDQQATKVREILKARLEGVKADAWTAALQNNTQPVKMAFQLLIPGDLKFGPKTGIFESLEQLADAILVSKDRAFRRRWIDAISLLSSKGQREIYEHTVSKILDGASVPSMTQLLLLAGDPLVKNRVVAARPDDASKQIVFKLLRSKEGRKWLKDRGGIVRPWIANSKSQTKQQLAALLQSFEDGKIEERKYWAEVIRKDWRLRRPKS